MYIRQKNVHTLPNTSTVALGKMVPITTLASEEFIAVQAFLFHKYNIIVKHMDHFNSVQQIQRIQTKDGLRFYSKVYTRPTKSNSSCIRFHHKNGKVIVYYIFTPLFTSIHNYVGFACGEVVRYLLLNVEDVEVAVACVQKWQVHITDKESTCIYKDDEHEWIVKRVDDIVNLVVTIDLDVSANDRPILYVVNLLQTSLMQSWTERKLK